MRAPRLAAVAAVVLLAAAGCTGSASPTPAPTDPTAASPSALPSPTATANDTEAELLDGVREYYRTVDRVYQDPSDAAPLKDVTGGTEFPARPHPGCSASPRSSPPSPRSRRSRRSASSSWNTDPIFSAMVCCRSSSPTCW